MTSFTRVLMAACLAIAIGPLCAAELTVSAAASLTNAFREIGPLFEARHAGVRVQFNFGASGMLLQQIARGAPVDVFASADQATMDTAQAQGLIDRRTRRDFTGNALVLVTPIAAAAPATLAQLTGAQYARIAVGVPETVPVGRYTREALEKAGLWRVLAPKVIAAQNVRQALDYVARGEVDAGFVYATDAAMLPGKVKVAFTVPGDTPVRYPMAPVASASQPALARDFIEFMLSPPAQAVLAKYGFTRP